MRRTAVINVVGLTPRLLGEHTPRLSAFAQAAARAAIEPAFPAVTCPAQTAYLTGRPPAQHGIVGNGWYDRALAEVHFWKQSNHLVQAPRLWHRLRAGHPDFTCAKLFWWFNMYADVEWSVTPRPMYPADGRKVFDIYAWPYALRPALKRDLGEFPFPAFWGPAAGVDSPVGPPDAASRWIAAAARWIERHHRPTLNLVYLPHLDYNLQRLGPDHPAIAADLRRIDDLAGGLVAFFQERDVRVVVLSEYGLVPVRRPVHLNRVLRRAGWLVVKEELGRERLDSGASEAFAVADHQVAHLYLKRPDLADAVRETVTALPGVARVLDAEEKRARGLDHPRAGDLIAVAEPDAWFTYYYWEDDARAPDFARTVDIHRKPGYDPVELFARPDWSPLRLKAHIARRLLQKRLGFRMLMDVIPLDATLVRGSHGAPPAASDDWPLLLTDTPDALPAARLPATEVFEVLRRTVAG